MVTEIFKSHDGTLELLIVRESGDITIGFKGYPWHTHGDVLIGEYKLIGVVIETPEQAVQRLLQDLVANKIFICTLRKNSKIMDVYISWQEPELDKYAEADEITEIRFWNN